MDREDDSTLGWGYQKVRGQRRKGFDQASQDLLILSISLRVEGWMTSWLLRPNCDTSFLFLRVLVQLSLLGKLVRYIWSCLYSPCNLDMPPKVLAQSCSQLLLSASPFIFSSQIQSTSILVLSGEALLYAFLLKNPLNCSEMMLWNSYSWSMNLAISLLKASTFFSKAKTFSQMAPSMLSTFISLSLLGLRLRVISSLMAMRLERQLSTIQFSSRYSSNFSPLRKVPLMIRLRLSSTYRCYLLTSSMSSEDSNFSPMSHQIKVCYQSDWMSFSISCLASRKMDILLILKLMISSLGVWRRDQRLMRRSQTAE